MLLDTSKMRGRGSIVWPGSQRSGSPQSAEDDGWREFVRAHEVCYETGPLIVAHDGQRGPVGFEIALYARHPDGLAADPSGPASLDLRRGLSALAEHVWPVSVLAQEQVARIQPERARLLLRRENGWTPEVSVRVEIQARSATFQEPDGRLRGCLHALEQRLLEQGVHRGGWRAR